MLFLFSTHSFSGEIDGKGIDCVISVNYGTRVIEEKRMWWFNNGLVTDVRSNYNLKNGKPDIRKTPSKVLKEGNFISPYDTSANSINWRSTDSSFAIAFYNLDRKNLEIIGGKKAQNLKFLSEEEIKELDRGTCRAFVGFEEVEKRQEELLQKAKDKYNKAREGNKI